MKVHCGFVDERFSPLLDCALTEVHCDVTVLDLVAEVAVSQRFHNSSTTACLGVTYVFPLHPAASVVGFQAEIAGRVVVGQVKEKQQAKREYNEAVARGDGAYLMEQGATDDVFQLKVGNLPPGADVVVRITYITELKFSKELGAELVIPATIAPRYTPSAGFTWRPPPCYLPDSGMPYFFPMDQWCPPGCRRGGCGLYPKAWKAALTANPSAYTSQPFYGMRVQVRWNAASRIVKVNSPSHSVTTALGGGGGGGGDNSNSNMADIRLTNDVVGMDRDFVLNVTTSMPSEPRVVVERSAHSYAAMITLCPDLAAAGGPHAGQQAQQQVNEFIFVVDRSGSMSGAKIDAVRHAMQVFLRSLPPNCRFNIVGFGSNFKSLFPASQAYAQASMQTASKHVAQMKADLGGTELVRPLKHINSTRATVPRKVFLLTDGQVSNTEAVIAEVQAHQATTQVFTIGIGESVSHALVEGVARAGNGTAQFVLPSARGGPADDLTPKIMSQLKNAMQACLAHVDVAFYPPGVDHSVRSICHGPLPGAAEPPADLVNPDTAVHHNIVCDVCNANPVVGRRYKCTVCPDYDLCATCYAKVDYTNIVRSIHSHGNQPCFVEMDASLTLPRGGGFGGGGGGGGITGFLGGLVNAFTGGGGGGGGGGVAQRGYEPNLADGRLAVVPAPHRAPPLFDGSNFVFYAMLPASQPLPAKVRVTAMSPTGEVSWSLPVVEAEVYEGMTVHRLAARRLIRDLDDAIARADRNSQHCLHPHFRTAPAAKAEMIRLSTSMSVLSSQTAFIAVERRSAAERLHTQLAGKSTQAVPSTAPHGETTATTATTTRPGFGNFASNQGGQVVRPAASNAAAATDLFLGAGSNTAAAAAPPVAGGGDLIDLMDDGDQYEFVVIEESRPVDRPPPQQMHAMAFGGGGGGGGGFGGGGGGGGGRGGGGMRRKAGAAPGGPMMMSKSAAPMRMSSMAACAPPAPAQSFDACFSSAAPAASAAPAMAAGAAATNFDGFSFQAPKQQHQMLGECLDDAMEEDEDDAEGASDIFAADNFAADNSRMKNKKKKEARQPAREQAASGPAARDVMGQLMMAQQFDGQFAVTPAQLAGMVGKAAAGAALAAAMPAGVSDAQWATALCIAVFETHLRALAAEWELMVAKARTWLTPAVASATASAARDAITKANIQIA